MESIGAEHRNLIKEIQDFWFPVGWDRDSDPPGHIYKVWFGGGPELDKQI